MSNMNTFVDALDKIRAGMRNLDGIVEGSDAQAEAVLTLAREFQTLASTARMLRSDYRHGRSPYAVPDCGNPGPACQDHAGTCD